MAWELEQPEPEPQAQGGGGGGWQLEPTPTPARSRVSDWGKTFTDETAKLISSYSDVLKRPVSIIESGAHILSSAPAFMAGVVGAVQQGLQGALAGESMADIEDRVRAGFKRDFDTTAEYMPIYAPKNQAEAETVTTTVMSPALFAMHLANTLADLDVWDPDQKAALRLVGEVGGLVLQGKAHSMIKGGKGTADLTGSEVMPKLDTAFSRDLIQTRRAQEAAQVPGRPLNRLANVEESLRAEREAGFESGPRARQAADTIESSPPSSTMSPAERSAWVFEEAFDQNVTPQAALGLNNRLGELQAAGRPEFQAIETRLARERELTRQAELAGDKVGPNTSSRDLPENTASPEPEPQVAPSPSTLPKPAPVPASPAPSPQEVIKAQEVAGERRRIQSIMSDLNTSLGKRGEVGAGKQLTPDQVAARTRLSKDLVSIKRNAARTGKEVGAYLRDLGVDQVVVDSLLGASDQIKKGLPIVTPQQLADQHNLTFNGVWELPPELNRPPMFTFTDNLTKGTFTTDSLSELPVKLAEHRRMFGVEGAGSAPPASPRSGAPPAAGPRPPQPTPTSTPTKGAGSYTTPASTPPRPPTKPPIEDVVSGMGSDIRGQGFFYRLTRTKQGVSEALNSPEVVFSRDPSGTGTRIYEAFDRADQEGNAFMLREGKDLDLAARGIKEGSESDLRVGSALDGKIQRSDLSLTERKLYDVLRGKFDHLLDRYVKSAASSDKSYRDIVYRANKREAPNPNWTPDELKAYELMMRRVKDYLPHIFDRDALLAEFKVEAAQIRQKLSTEIQSSKLNFQKSRLRELESSIQKLQGGELVTYDSLPTSIRMRFFEPRKGKKGYSLSAVKAYRTYLSGIRRKLYDEPAVRVAAELHKSLDPSLREYNKWYVRRYLGWDKHKLDSLAGAISSFQWMRTLGLNPRSAVVNLTQRINTITEVGPKYSLAGQKAAFTRAGKEAFDRTGIAREIPQVLLEGDSPVGMENVRAIVGYLFNKVELGNRRHAFLSGRAKALASGKSEPQASRAGVDTVHRTQFRYGRVGMPRVLSHPVGRIGLQFWSYPIKQMELIVRWAKTDPKKLLTYIALAEGGKETLKQLLNVDLSNALGFGMNLGEAIQALRDIPDGDFRGFFRHMRLAMSEGGGMLPSGLGPTPSSLLKVIEKAKESRGLEALGKELSPVMTNRMVQTYKAITKRHVDKEGKGLYPIYNQDKQLMYYLTGKQLLMRSIGPRSATETKQYVDFRKDYLLDKEHQDILRDITRAIIDGNDKKANLLINKYGLVPSEKALVNEALRRELPYEERREINKTQRQREWETIREGEE